MSNKSINLLSLVVVAILASMAPADLLIHWGLNESTGTTASDSVGSNHGTLVGNAAWDPAGGQFGGAALFDGADDSIRLRADEGPFPVADYPFTLMGWVKSTKGSAKAVIATIVQAPFEYYWIGLISGNAGIVARTSAGMYEQRSGSAIADDQWHHLCGVYHGPEDRVLYLDGVEVTTDSRTAPFLPNVRQFAVGALDRDPAGENIVDEMLGSVDDVAVFSEALDVDTINQYMIHGIPTQSGVASNPSPADGSTDVPRDTVLTWEPGELAGTHHVYFSATLDDINDGTALISENQAATSYDPGLMDFGVTYYWRVDEVNATPDKTVFEGPVWSFEVEPYSIQIPGSSIIVSASSVSNEISLPEKTTDGSGLEGLTHTTNQNDMWLSASPDVTPWLLFEFDEIQKLDHLLIWNANAPSEAFIGWGIKDLNIEVSTDGVVWTTLADSGPIDQAPGRPTYDTPQTIDLGLVLARYVRLNILNNWGGLLKQYGVSEVQFYALPVRPRTPNPASGSVDVRPDATVTWRAGREAVQHTLYMDSDQEAVSQGTTTSVTSVTNSVDLTPLDLQLGETYYWRVDEVNEAETQSVWAGPVWSLSTPSALVVDDFEGYGNLSPNRPFQTWLDGFGYSADDFFPVAYAGNGTGAGTGHDIWSPSSPYFNGQIMETSSTLPGSLQAMPFYYSNTAGTASQTERHFAEPQDWTIGGARTLSIAFRGQAGNTGTPFVMINNAKVVYARDPGNLGLGTWQAWNIDLSSVNTNLQTVTKLVIGVEGNGAAGLILIDDIKLHAEAGQVIIPVDPGDTGLVAHYTFEGNANDVSGHGNNGTLNGDPQFVTGHDGSALDCDGIDNYVSTGKTASDLGIGGNNPRTVSAWVYTRTYNNGGIYDVGARVTAQDFCLRTLSPDDDRWRVQYWGGDSDFSVDSKDKWVHFTHVHDGVSTKIYANGMLVVDWAKTIDTPDTNPFQIGCYGWQVDYFDGLIDEVRVYNRALSAGEALSLAGVTAPVDKPF